MFDAKKPKPPKTGTILASVRKRKPELTREEYESIGIPWSATPEYHREKVRESYARKKAILWEKQADIERLLAKKEALHMLPSQQTHLEDVIQYHPALAPDGKPWGCPQPVWDVAEYEATPEEDRDRVHGTAKRWEYLAYKSERDHWAAGTHRRQNGLE